MYGLQRIFARVFFNEFCLVFGCTLCSTRRTPQILLPRRCHYAAPGFSRANVVGAITEAKRGRCGSVSSILKVSTEPIDIEGAIPRRKVSRCARSARFFGFRSALQSKRLKTTRKMTAPITFLRPSQANTAFIRGC